MKKLNAKVKALLIDAIKTTGSYDPSQTLFLFEESLTLVEAETVEQFLAWVNADSETRYFGTATLDERFEQFKKSLTK